MTTTTNNNLSWFEFESHGSGSGSGNGSGSGSDKGSGGGSGVHANDTWIKGQLSNDLNFDDTEIGNDFGFEGQSVKLFKADGTFVAETKTDAKGAYQFDTVAGDYYIQFPQIDGFGFADYNVGGDKGDAWKIDSDALDQTGRSVTFWAEGTLQSNIDASYQAQGGQIGWLKGRLSFDDDKDDTEVNTVGGGFDSGLAGRVVELYDSHGTKVAEATTGNDGSYQFDVPEGEYKIKFPEVNGLQFANKGVGASSEDSDANADGYSDPIWIDGGKTIADIDASYQHQPGAIGWLKGRLSLDDDQDDTEVNTDGGGLDDGLAGYVVEIFDVDGEKIGQTTTDANGMYQFDVPEGEYRLKFPDIDGLGFADKGVGDATTDSDANPDGFSDVFGITGGQTIMDLDVSYQTAKPNTTDAVDDSDSTEFDASVVINVLANDIDLEGDAQTINGFDDTSANGGTVTQNADGNLVYTPAPGFTGTDTFEYSIIDANGATDSAIVTITVEDNPIPNTTDAKDDDVATDLNTPVTIDVLGNDTDPEGDTQEISTFDGASENGGVVTQDVDGNLVYTPAPGFTGTDTFEYTVIDANGATDTAKVTVVVTDNTPPNTTDAVDDTSTTELDTPITIVVLGNDTDPEGDSQTVTDFDGTTGNGGSVLLNANGDLVYTPAPGFTGTDTFEYTITDANGATDTATVTVTVEDNSKPNTTDAVDDASVTEIDTPIVVEVLSNDTDPEGDSQTVTDFDGTTDNGGSVLLNANGDLVYTPAPGFTGTDTFEYTITDANGATDTATVTVTVEDNSKPNTTDAVDDASVTEIDTPIVVEVLSNDTDPEGDSQTVTDFDGTTGNGGSVLLNANGDLVYTPAPGFTGTDTFEYTITDANGATDTATVTVTVEDNSKPNTTDAVDDAETTDIDTPVTIEVLGNDADPEGDSQTVTDFDGTTDNGGTVVLNANGDLVYTPAPGFTGTDTFEYTITDANGATDTATVSVKVEDNSTPNTTDAVDDAETTDIDTPVAIEVLGNDTDPEGDTQTVTGFDGISENGGSVLLNANGDLVYTPAPGFTGTDTFEYTITDANGATDTATVTVTVEDNSKPNTTDAIDDAETTDINTPVVVNVLGNDVDVEGDGQSIEDFDDVSENGGFVAMTREGNLVYIPADGFTGTDTFTYTIVDENGASDTATVTITVEDVKPVNTTDAVDDSSTTDEGQPVTIDVLDNDLDAEGDAQTIQVFDPTSANGGTVTQDANGDLVYTPAPGFTGTDTFEYTVIDANGATDTAKVNVVVEAVKPPNTTDAVDDVANTDLNAPVSIDVLANDTDPEDDGQSVQSFEPASANGGTVIQDTNGNLVYTPAAGFSGIDTFEYTVVDTNGATDTATVTVTVVDNTPKNSTDAIDDSATTGQDQAVSIDVLGNDVDPENDAQSVQSFDPTSANGGTVTQDTNGNLIYTPATGFAGTDTFEYVVVDSQGASDVATVTVTVDKAANTEPDAVDDSGSAAKGNPVVIDLLENDSDPEGDPLQIMDTTDGEFGQVTLDGDGNAVYTPNDPDFVGTDKFTYTITDGNGGFDTATVTVEITDDKKMIMGTEGDDKRIEGTDGDDHVLGKDGHDCLVISDGDDTLDGGYGYDVVIFESGSSNDYFFEANADGTVTVTGDSGADLLIDIEGIYFEQTDEWFAIEDLVEDV